MASAWTVVEKGDGNTVVVSTIEFVAPQTRFYRPAIEAAVRVVYGMDARLVDWELDEPNDECEPFPVGATVQGIGAMTDEDWQLIAEMATDLNKVLP